MVNGESEKRHNLSRFPVPSRFVDLGKLFDEDSRVNTLRDEVPIPSNFIALCGWNEFVRETKTEADESTVGESSEETDEDDEYIPLSEWNVRRTVSRQDDFVVTDGTVLSVDEFLKLENL